MTSLLMGRKTQPTNHDVKVQPLTKWTRFYLISLMQEEIIILSGLSDYQDSNFNWWIQYGRISLCYLEVDSIEG